LGIPFPNYFFPNICQLSLIQRESDPQLRSKWHNACPISSGKFVLGVFQYFRLPGVGAIGTRMPSRRLSCLAACGFLLGLVLACTLAAQTGSSTNEYRTKASFLATFPNFIDWPDEAFSKAGAPFVMCVVGDFQFGTSLAEMTRSASPHGRRVEVRWVHKDPEARNCHILFVSRSESKRYSRLLQAVQGVDVLTVGETPDFLEAGGAMTFLFKDEALQFEVNLVAATGAHLRMSSRLLALARRVVNKPESDKG
jgi:hypothetical protein